VNLLVKYTEISSPRDAISAISPALGFFFSDVFGIALFFLPGGLPRGNEVIILPLGVMPDFEDHRTKPAATATDCAKLIRIVILLVDDAGLIEDFLRFLQADAVSLLDGPALLPVKPEPRQHI
jgi:hypothetical protein